VILNRKEILNLLLEDGADLDKKNNAGQTPLFLACELGHTDIAKLLLDFGANPNLVLDDNGHTVLHYLAEIDWKVSEEIINLLCKSGVDVNKENNTGKTPLHGAFIAAARRSTQKTDNVSITMVSLLLQNGANPNSESFFGFTPCHLYMKQLYENSRAGKAVMFHKDLVMIMKEYGADLNAWQGWGSSMLDYANVFENKEMAEFLKFGGAVTGEELQRKERELQRKEFVQTVIGVTLVIGGLVSYFGYITYLLIKHFRARKAKVLAT
jgi:hypothetical protein